MPRFVENFHQVSLHNRLITTSTNEWSHHDESTVTRLVKDTLCPNAYTVQLCIMYHVPLKSVILVQKMIHVSTV